MTPLRKRMLEDMRIRNFSPHTQTQYIRRVSMFARHFGRSPDQLSFEDVRAYLVHLTERKTNFGVMVNTISALRFFYMKTLRRGWDFNALPYPRRERKLPDVPNREIVFHFLTSVSNLKHRVMLTTCYAAGLRVSEVRALRVSDIDGQRMLIHVRLAKGKKDRIVPLSPALLENLRAYWQIARPKNVLFPADGTDRPMSPRSISNICAVICERAGITPNITPHTLRHSFATHLMESGTNVRAIQMMMGHTSLSTTAGYMRIAASDLLATKIPLELPPLPT
jgi:site-specific recombinase XerD